MSQLTGQPSTKKPRTRNVKWSPGRDEFDPRSVVFGVILAAVVWPLLILFLWLATRHLGSETIDPSLKMARAKPRFDINIVPDQFIMPRKPQPPPPKFVETNPDAPENMPSANTSNFAARNQQSAQEKPDPNANGDHAATEGKKDFESTQVVSGQLTPPTEAPPPEPPPTPEVAQALEKAAEARKAENPLAGFEKREGLNPDGIGMNKSSPSDSVTKSDEKVEGTKDAPMTVGNPSPAQPRIDPRKPQPRMHIDQQRVRPAIFTENKIGSRNIGPASWDARWSNYGAYLQRMVDSVQIQFDNLVEHSGVYPPTGTVVTIKFRLDKKGLVVEIIDCSTVGGSQAQAEAICKSAITTRAPYGEWTDDMVALLGDSQEFTWNFYYGTP